MIELMLFLLPIASLSGWYLGKKSNFLSTRATHHLHRDYFIGLNYLINEQPDKAVDVFIKLLEVDSDTVEIHLALGSLFRRRGELDRAIRIHQNLIERPQLTKRYRTQALYELAQDYFKVGVLDRAEQLFLESASHGEETASSLHNLLNIYQQQKDWVQAISIAKKLEPITYENMSVAIAHFYCELAENMKSLGDLEQAQVYIKNALSTDKKCVRANLLQANLEMMKGNYESAISSYKRVKIQDADYVSEIIAPISECYEELKRESELILYLNECLTENACIPIVLSISKHIEKQKGERAAINFVAEQIQYAPSLRGLERLIELYLSISEGDTKHKLLLLRDLISKLLTDRFIYRCKNCGFSGSILYWCCPGCKHWSTVRPIHRLEIH